MRGQAADRYRSIIETGARPFLPRYLHEGQRVRKRAEKLFWLERVLRPMAFFSQLGGTASVRQRTEPGSELLEQDFP